MRSALEIAGFRLRVTPPPGFEAVVDDPRYASFLRATDSRAFEVPVELLLGPLPDLRGLAPAFDSGVAWTAYRQGTDLLFDYRLPDSGERLWTARLSSGAAPEVTVYCGERLAGTGEPLRTLHSPLSYPLDQLLLMCLLTLEGGLLVHSAGVRRGDRAVVCPGRSGAGKSTLSRLLEARPDLVRMSDDRMVLRASGARFRAWGTPWAGTERIAESDSAPLVALAFLHQSPRTELRPIGPAEGLPQLLAVGSVPWFDIERATECLAFCDALLREVPLYELHFRRHEEVGEVLEQLF